MYSFIQKAYKRLYDMHQNSNCLDNQFWVLRRLHILQQKQCERSILSVLSKPCICAVFKDVILLLCLYLDYLLLIYLLTQLFFPFQSISLFSFKHVLYEISISFSSCLLTHKLYCNEIETSKRTPGSSFLCGLATCLSEFNLI